MATIVFSVLKFANVRKIILRKRALGVKVQHTYLVHDSVTCLVVQPRALFHLIHVFVLDILDELSYLERPIRFQTTSTALGSFHTVRKHVYLLFVCFFAICDMGFRVLWLDFIPLGSTLSKYIPWQGWLCRIAKMYVKVQHFLFFKLHVCRR